MLLKKLLSPLTTATASGVGTRYLVSQVGAILAILGVFGLLTEDQRKVILDNVEVLGPTLILAWGGVQWAWPTLYAMITKSSSNKAAEVAKAVDKEIAPAEPVEIITEGTGPNIVIPGKSA
jgi:hypothetical protein